MSADYFCKICDIPCTGKAPYEQHLNSVKHIRKAKLNESQKSSDQSVISTNTSPSIPAINTRPSFTTKNDNISEDLSFASTSFIISRETMRILLEWTHPRGYKPYCEICQLLLHGENNVDLHFQSNNNIHNQKLSVWKQICENDAKYSCKVCLEIFANEYLMIEHFESDYHANLVQQKINLEKFMKIYEAYNKLKQVRKQTKSLENQFQQLKIIDGTQPISKSSTNLPINMVMLQNAMKNIVEDEYC
ncbi:unnamed protein product [Rotaria sp. Silwood1]|nr:unnamed protein product [Rotaria sp. Silwood1]CAF0743045.1 unnamed protein product [Rotaria sp. Silwood1]CAF3335892.1 unnamed protein product [Rotaria sp. Silwood1]CAF3346568.1 unnamed protein product [Rotaria sp. Silwood1]CAF4512673.1 unnamed protein product [Rotaria sp. Silwood1]